MEKTNKGTPNFPVYDGEDEVRVISRSQMVAIVCDQEQCMRYGCYTQCKVNDKFKALPTIQSEKQKIIDRLESFIAVIVDVEEYDECLKLLIKELRGE